MAEAQPELVAQHFGEASDAETAIQWWLRAGERAMERALCAETEACARRGLALLDRLPDEGARLFLGCFSELQLLLERRDDALRTVEGAFGLARATGEAHFLAELLRLKGEALLGLEGHDENEAEALFREAIEIARGQEANLGAPRRNEPRAALVRPGQA